jgi:hypothetical protein
MGAHTRAEGLTSNGSRPWHSRGRRQYGDERALQKKLEVMATTRRSAEHRLAGEEERDPGEAFGAKILAGTEENMRVMSLATYVSDGSANFCVRIEREIGEEDSRRICVVDDVLNTRDREARSEGRDRRNRREQRRSRVAAEWREWN